MDSIIETISPGLKTTAALPYLPVIRTLGGCGGTLLSRLFGALPRTLVLSETNPRSANLFCGHLNPLRQLRQWQPELLRGVAEFDETELGCPTMFGDMLQRLCEFATRTDYRIIVRDYSYADFIGVPFIWPVPADSSLDAALQNRFHPRSIYLVRHPVDQLASLRTHRSVQRVLSAKQFVEGSHAFLDCRADAPLFRYEDLTATPAANFRLMCEALAVPYVPEALSRFAEVKNVTGHTARALDGQIARPAPSAGAARAREELIEVSGYQALLSRQGYAQAA